MIGTVLSNMHACTHENFARFSYCTNIRPLHGVNIWRQSHRTWQRQRTWSPTPTSRLKPTPRDSASWNVCMPRDGRHSPRQEWSRPPGTPPCASLRRRCCSAGEGMPGTIPRGGTVRYGTVQTFTTVGYEDSETTRIPRPQHRLLGRGL